MQVAQAALEELALGLRLRRRSRASRSRRPASISWTRLSNESSVSSRWRSSASNSVESLVSTCCTAPRATRVDALGEDAVGLAGEALDREVELAPQAAGGVLARGADRRLELLRGRLGVAASPPSRPRGGAVRPAAVLDVGEPAPRRAAPPRPARARSAPRARARAGGAAPRPRGARAAARPRAARAPPRSPRRAPSAPAAPRRGRGRARRGARRSRPGAARPPSRAAPRSRP